MMFFIRQKKYLAMAGKKTDIMDLRQLIRLKQQRLSNRKIAESINISRNTVNGYIRLFNAYKLGYKELLSLSDASLEELFPSESEIESHRYKELSQHFSYFEKELKKPGCTQQVLWREYLEKHPDGYKHSQFNYHFNKWQEKTKVSCKLQHKFGEKLFIDFTGKKLSVINKLTGEINQANVFVAILPSSGYTFVTATRTQSKEDVIQALNKCLKFIGGDLWPLCLII